MNRQRVFEATLAYQLERIAKIHSAKVTEVTVSNRGGPAPGWSAEGRIGLEPSMLPDPTDVDGLAVWIGVLMHEVGHCAWSPEASRWPTALRMVANLAEDQRQEHIVLDELPGVVDPFRQAVSNLIIKRSPTARGPLAERVWPLIAGRLYLSKKLRAGVRAAAIAEKGIAWTKEVEELIAAFKALKDPGFADYDAAIRILEKLNSLLPNMQTEDVGCAANGTGTPGIGAAPEWDDTDDEADEADGDGDGAGAGDGDGEESDAEGAGMGEGEGEGEGGGGGEGTGQTSRQDGIASIRELAEQEKKESGESLQRQAKAILRRVWDEVGVAQRDSRPVVWQPPSAEARAVQRRLMQHLKPLLQAADAGLEHMTAHGRIRPEREAAGYRPDQVFDKWRVDQHDTVAAHIVLAVDISGSMSSDMVALSEAIWVIRQVVSKTASKLTVLLWDDKVMEYQFPLNQRVPILGARGSTDVTGVVKLATETFGESRSRRKWLIIMTDGHSSHDRAEVEPMFADLEKSGVAVTALEYNTHSESPQDTPHLNDWGVTHRMAISSLVQIPQLLGDMLRKVYRRVA